MTTNIKTAGMTPAIQETGELIEKNDTIIQIPGNTKMKNDSSNIETLCDASCDEIALSPINGNNEGKIS